MCRGAETKRVAEEKESAAKERKAAADRAAEAAQSAAAPEQAPETAPETGAAEAPEAAPEVSPLHDDARPPLRRKRDSFDSVDTVLWPKMSPRATMEVPVFRPLSSVTA